MQEESIPSPRKRALSGFQRRKLRVAAGFPRYTEREAAQRRLDDAIRGKRRSKSTWANFTARVTAINLERGCADCGYQAHPAALHFDHLPGTVKRRDLSRMSSLPWQETLAEIDKCEVVCANCHAIRTAARRARSWLLPHSPD